MILAGTLVVLAIASFAIIVSSCMLSSRYGREEEQHEWLTIEMGGQWPGTTFGGNYTTKVPHCSFEPEDLEDIKAVGRF